MNVFLHQTRWVLHYYVILWPFFVGLPYQNLVLWAISFYFTAHEPSFFIIFNQFWFVKLNYHVLIAYTKHRRTIMPQVKGQHGPWNNFYPEAPYQVNPALHFIIASWVDFWVSTCVARCNCIFQLKSKKWFTVVLKVLSKGNISPKINKQHKSFCKHTTHEGSSFLF